MYSSLKHFFLVISNVRLVYNWANFKSGPSKCVLFWEDFFMSSNLTDMVKIRISEFSDKNSFCSYIYIYIYIYIYFTKVSTKKCPQKVSAKIVHKKVSQKCFPRKGPKKCLNKVSTRSGRGTKGKRKGSGRGPYYLPQ